jgi:hypothetical protein
MFHINSVPDRALSPHHDRTIPIHIIRPDFPLKKLGVDFTTATPEGLLAVYQYGQEQGLAFASSNFRSL